ncbi:unnamed protein product [Clavelina lepadiformis]|uniref:Uncharacterized protein n=1 Tax=Clavelina lepadiformis TaxID=159417 RepID=A0ABP0FUG7_CLALP
MASLFSLLWIREIAPCLPHEFRQRTPLSEITKQGLNGVAHRRYKVSSYSNDYKTPHLKDQDSENSLNIGRRKKVEETQRYPLENQEKHAVKGLWPSWPAGNNYIVSNVTGQIVEKRDVRSLDDLRDYRKHKMFCNYSTPRGDKKVLPAESKFLSYASSEYAPLQDIDMYGCDLEKIGDGNTDREIPVGTTQYNSLNYRQLKRLLRPRKVWCEEDTMTQPSNKNIETNNQKAPPIQTRQVTENMKECSYRNHLKKLQDYREQENLEFAMRQRWVADKRLGCLSEHVIELDSDTSPPHPSPSKSCSSDLSVEEVEDDTEKDQHQRKVQFGDVNIALYPKEKTEVNEKPQYHFRTPYYSTRTNYAADGEIENPVVTSDFRSVSLELARSTETVSGFLKSMSSAEEAKKRAFEKAKEERLKFADLQKQGSKEHEERCTLLDSTCTLYKPNIKLPPHKLWTSLQYNGNRVPDRLGVRFKTIASKRYHAVHHEMIPDPRDFRPPLRKNKFLGYHTSVFR